MTLFDRPRRLAAAALLGLCLTAPAAACDSQPSTGTPTPTAVVKVYGIVPDLCKVADISAVTRSYPKIEVTPASIARPMGHMNSLTCTLGVGTKDDTTGALLQIDVEVWDNLADSKYSYDSRVGNNPGGTPVSALGSAAVLYTDTLNARNLATYDGNVAMVGHWRAPKGVKPANLDTQMVSVLQSIYTALAAAPTPTGN